MLKELFHSPQASVQGDLSHPGRDLFAAVVLVGEIQSGIDKKMRPLRHAGFRDQAQATGIEDFRDRSLGNHMQDARLGNGDGVNSGQVGQWPDDIPPLSVASIALMSSPSLSIWHGSEILKLSTQVKAPPAGLAPGCSPARPRTVLGYQGRGYPVASAPKVVDMRHYDRLDTFRSLNTPRQPNTTTNDKRLQSQGCGNGCYPRTTTTVRESLGSGVRSPGGPQNSK